MPIAVQCPSCDARFRVPETVVGRKAPCGKCGVTFTIASSPDAADRRPPAERLTPEKLAEAFQGPIQPVRAAASYRLSLLFSTIVMVLLPMAYLALIALVAYGVYYHAVNHTGMLQTNSGRGVFYVFLAYAAPLVIGPILVFFMIKPLFARASNRQRSRSLRRESEPVLFALVDQICDAVGAPRPRRIDVDCQVNASAGFRNGVWSMLGNDLVLTIGVPLAAGMTTRQLAGVLAHEFGHFSQGVGMRLTYLLRVTSHWFARVTYERDAWDEWLASAAGGIDIRIGWIFYLAMLVVWLTRKVLWVLLHVGFAVAGHTLRQMEFDADRYEARLSGSAAFPKTARRLQELGVGMHIAQSQLGQSHLDGKLVDNLPGLVRINADKLPEEAVKFIEGQLTESRTGWLDTHPCEKDRIANALAEDAPGVFHLDAPASCLFADFDAQCRATTWDFYLVALDGKVDKSSLQPLSEVAAAQEEQEQASEALQRYTQGTWRPFRALPIALPARTQEKPQQVLERLKATRRAVSANAPSARRLLEKQDEQEGRQSTALRVTALHNAGVGVPKKAVDAELQNHEGARAATAHAKRLIKKYDERLRPFDQRAGDRLSAALELLRCDALAKRLPDIQRLRQRSDALVAAHAALDGQLGALNELYERHEQMQQLAGVMDGSQPSHQFVETLTGCVKSCHGKYASVRGALSHTRYPFPHAERDMTLGKFLAPAEAAIDDVSSTFQAIAEMMNRLVPLRHRVAAELCQIAEQVEQAVGLPPLEAPPKEPPNPPSPETPKQEAPPTVARAAAGAPGLHCDRAF